METIREATIEIVKVKDLNIGDKILYSNMELTVAELPNPYTIGGSMPLFGRSVKAHQFDDTTSILNVGPFRHYYRIIDSIKYDACISCGDELGEKDHPSIGGGFCDECHVSNTMGSYNNPDTGIRWTDEEIETAQEEFMKQYVDIKKTPEDVAESYSKKPAGKIFPDAVESIRNKKCPTCGEDIGKFKDEISKREYEISGMCQECQNGVFG